LSTLTIVRKGNQVAMAADALTTFEETRLPPANDAAPQKIIQIGDALVGIVGYTAHFLVIERAMAELRNPDFSSRAGVFETFHVLHPILKEHYYLLPEAEEGDPYESSQASVLIASPHGIFGVYDLREVHEYRRFWAMGSGTSFALGAMWARYDDDALSAAEVAELGATAGAEFDRSSSPPIEVRSFELSGGPPPPARPVRPRKTPAGRAR
jgi:ATP-dependent protease HslVU (ClpYQ) peptidase subunit